MRRLSVRIRQWALGRASSVVEHLLGKKEAEGSIPSFGSQGVCQSGQLGWTANPEGETPREFKSHRLRNDAPMKLDPNDPEYDPVRVGCWLIVFMMIVFAVLLILAYMR